MSIRSASKIAAAVWLLFSVEGAFAIDKSSARIAAVVEQRFQKIRQELKGSDLPPWSGEYYYGDGLSTNVTLVVAPAGGFAFQWHGCLGTYDLNYGSVSFANDTLRLRPELPNRPDEPLQGIATELLPIGWGARHYLIARSELLAFCNAINAHEEPRREEDGSFLLRDGDEKRRVRGFPKLPQPFQSQLLRRPIVAHVAAVRAPRAISPRGERSSNWRATQATLDVGKDQRVFLGMEFHVLAPDEVLSAEVVAVKDRSADVMFYQHAPDADSPRPAVGWKLSTRPRYR